MRICVSGRSIGPSRTTLILNLHDGQRRLKSTPASIKPSNQLHQPLKPNVSNAAFKWEASWCGIFPQVSYSSELRKTLPVAFPRAARGKLEKLDEADRRGVWAFTPASFSALFGNPAPNYVKLMMKRWADQGAYKRRS